MASEKPSEATVTLAQREANESITTMSRIRSTLHSSTRKLGDALQVSNLAKVTKASKKRKAQDKHSSTTGTAQAPINHLAECVNKCMESPPIAAHHPSPRTMLASTTPIPLSPCDFEVGCTLGKGKFGRVYLARHIPTNYICALKLISKAQCTRHYEEPLIRRELEVHQNLAHKNILRLFAWFHDIKSVYLVLEYAPGGNLYSKLTKQPNGRFKEKAVARYVVQVAEALQYMHAKNVMHRDLKPENILLGLHGEIKLADFGYAVHSLSGARSTLVGTLDYISPEMATMMMEPDTAEEKYTTAVDQWSLGVLMYELLVGEPLFAGMKDEHMTLSKIARWNTSRFKCPDYIDPAARDLMKRLMGFEDGKRLSFANVPDHPWIKRHVDS